MKKTIISHWELGSAIAANDNSGAQICVAEVAFEGWEESAKRNGFEDFWKDFSGSEDIDIMSAGATEDGFGALDMEDAKLAARAFWAYQNGRDGVFNQRYWK